MRYLTSLLVLLATLLAGSCIKNDIPYPDVSISIDKVEGEGFSVDNIDLAKRTVTLKLDETTDIQNLKIDKVSYGALVHNTTIPKEELLAQVRTSKPLTGVFDLRTPLYTTLSLYQDYDWAIIAEQDIEFRFRVDGQVGSPVFDPINRTAIAYVSEATQLDQIQVNELKLGPADISSYSPAIDELSGDFTTVRFVDVTCHGRTEQWQLHVTVSTQSVELKQADAWSRVLWLYGTGIAGQDKGFRYREKGTTDWTDVPADPASSSFSAPVSVKSETTYEVKAYSGSNQTVPVERTTGTVLQLPNSGLENWSQPNSPWLPFLSDAAGKAIDPYWGSGNNGATTLGPSYNLTTPDKVSLRPGTTGSTSAKLESKYVVLKLAAGNLFAGEFAGIRGGTHGVVNFGRPFTLRPTGLRLWVKYTCGVIENDDDIKGAPAGVTVKKGDSDCGSIFIALGTWTKEKYGVVKDGERLGTDASPVSIDTREQKTFFNSKGPNVIAYGERLLTSSVTEWRQVTIPIVYRATDQTPTHIIVVCSASRYGDYFTGSRQSKMSIDDIELIYDWPVVEQ